MAFSDESFEGDIAPLGKLDRPLQISVLHSPAEQKREAFPPCHRGGKGRAVAVRDPYEHDPAGRPDKRERGIESLVAAGHFERNVDLERCDGCSERVRGCETVRDGINCEHLHGGADEQLHDQQAKRPAPEDSSLAAGLDGAEVERVQRDSERFEQCRGIIIKPLGHRLEQPFRPGKPRAQTTVGLAVAGKATVGAEMIETAAAQWATTTRSGGIDCDPLACPLAFRDRPGYLVPENQRSSDRCIADSTFEKPVSVRAAEADCIYPQHDLTRCGNRLRYVLEPKLAGTVEAKRLHDWP